MPFKRYRKRRAKKAIPKAAIATKSYVKKQLAKDVETKYVDVTAHEALIDTTGTVLSICDITQGIQDTMRIGDKITLRALHMSYTIAANTDTHNVVRVMVVQWYANTNLTGGNPAVGNILNYNPNGPISTNDARCAESPYIHDYQNQFAVLYDRKHVVNPIAEVARTYRAKVNMRYARKVVEYYAASATAASNKLFIMAVSDSSAGNHPKFTYCMRLHYDDA